MRILYLEDDEHFLEAFSQLVGMASVGQHEVVPARGVNDAIQIVASGEMIDLFMVDLKLASQDTGLTFLNQLKASNTHPNVPKIIVSDLSSNSISVAGQVISHDQLWEAGAIAYIEKKEIWSNGINEFFLRVQRLTLQESPLIPGSSIEISDPIPHDVGFTIFQSGIYGCVGASGVGIFGRALNDANITTCSVALLAFFSVCAVIPLIVPLASAKAK